ncbi:MAG: AmmeMemoRadiSam system radical SAM enzyme [Patescibacteria group bacterium]|nr:AmmeMemoRadiSam system radical SAM enzyme [Patescibacteria group bacterium]
MEQAKFYKKLNTNKVQCRLCHHFCIIGEGQTGICRARKNEKGKLYSLVYGYPIALNIDPIEKKPLFHFLPGSLAYSLGVLGCNFRCANCQNWDISQAEKIEEKIKYLDFIPPEKIVKNALASGCSSVAYTYNEPTIWAEYVLDIMKLARKNKLKNVWVSNGYISPDCLKAILPYLDAVNIDLKSREENFYLKNCGGKLKPVLDNLKILKKEKIHTEITTLIIPSLSDNPGMLKKIAEFIVRDLTPETPWHISKFSPRISWKLKNLPETEDEIIYQAYEIGKKAGLKYIYTGNMPSDEKENTYCPKCGQLAIKRIGYQIERLDKKGQCAKCGENLDIISLPR